MRAHTCIKALVSTHLTMWMVPLTPAYGRTHPRRQCFVRPPCGLASRTSRAQAFCEVQSSVVLLPVAVDPRNRQAVHQRGTGDDCLDSPRTRAHGEEIVWGCESNALCGVMLDFSQNLHAHIESIVNAIENKTTARTTTRTTTRTCLKTKLFECGPW